MEDVATSGYRRISGQYIGAFLLREMVLHQYSKVTIYYQLSDPISVILVYVLHILTGSRLIVHVLDNFIETRRYKKYLGIPRRLAIFMMRRANQLLAISPTMKEEFAATYGLTSHVAFRWRAVEVRSPTQSGNGKIIFGGAINDKTNAAALVEFARMLAGNSDARHLDIYARGGNKELNDLPNVTFKQPVDESTFISIAGAYDAFLVPFNQDEESLSFYRESCPSKASTLFAAQIPVLTFGPSEFWFLRFLAAHEFSTSSLNRLAACRRISADEYVRANEALGALCEVHSLAAFSQA